SRETGGAPRRYGLGPADFPYGTEPPGAKINAQSASTSPAEPQAVCGKPLEPDRRKRFPALSFLRAHGRYLTPGDGIDLWSGIAVVLRSLILNLLIWLPLLVAAFACLLWVSLDIMNNKNYWTLLASIPSPLPLVDARWLAPSGGCKEWRCEWGLPV